VTVLGMANAYATVADGGVYHAPSYIDHIVDHGGTTIYRGQRPGRQLIPTQVDNMVLQDLQNVVKVGTGVGAALPGREVGGKTGTTDQSTDAWFNGITPQMAASVWMGNPQGDSATYGMHYGSGGQVYGGSFPASAWQAFMGPAVAPTPPVDFPTPDPAQIPPGTFIDSPGTGGMSAGGGYNIANGLPSIGSSPDGLPPIGSPTNGSPTNGSPTNGSPTIGSPTIGSPTIGSPTIGSPTIGSPTIGSPTNGSPTIGSSPNGSNSSNGSGSKTNGSGSPHRTTGTSHR